MQKRMAQQLNKKAHEVASWFSNPDRPGNVLKETYNVEHITILSERTAAVVFHKKPTEKKAVAWFYYLALKKEPRWEYFFVAYDHLVGLNRVSRILNDVEQHNFSIATRKES